MKWNIHTVSPWKQHVGVFLSLSPRPHFWSFSTLAKTTTNYAHNARGCHGQKTNWKNPWGKCDDIHGKDKNNGTEKPKVQDTIEVEKSELSAPHEIRFSSIRICFLSVSPENSKYPTQVWRQWLSEFNTCTLCVNSVRRNTPSSKIVNVAMKNIRTTESLNLPLWALHSHLHPPLENNNNI